MTPFTRRGFLTLSGGLVARSALGLTAPPTEPAPMIDTHDLVRGNTAFALDLYGRLRSDAGNLFFSPLSISTALAMTSGGARGTTLEEMSRVLHLPPSPQAAFGSLLASVNGTGPADKRTYQLTTANAIWAQKGYPWRPEFTHLIRTDYGAGLFETNFGSPEDSRQAINAWVEKETREKIKDLVPAGEITSVTRMVLTNAIYFKGSWAAPLKKEKTQDQPFFLADGTTTPVPLMTQTGTFGYGTFTPPTGGPDQVLEMPYAGKELSMVVLLPAVGELGKLEEHLSPDSLATWTKDIRPHRVEVFLPRFKTDKATPLGGPLQALGMKAAFNYKIADFSGMQTGPELLYITAVLHKAFVDVNEEGTEAAAATGVVMGARAMHAGQPPVFRADRPFLFLIRENTSGTILFLGRVTNPKA